MPNQLAHTPSQSVKDLLNSDAVRRQIARALPAHMTPDRFLRVATTALLKTPKLAECSQESLMQTFLDCSALGLEPDGRLAHPIPYGKVCKLIIDWKGLVELAKRSGEVLKWRAESVCSNDLFSWRDGIISHEIDWSQPRGEVYAFYSAVTLKGGELDFEVLTKEEVEGIRDRSRAKDAGPWVTDYNEMGKKTAIRRHSKRLTLSPEFADALERDHDAMRPAVGREVSSQPALITAPIDPFPEAETPAQEAQKQELEDLA